jgi:hypothetical protein
LVDAVPVPVPVPVPVTPPDTAADTVEGVKLLLVETVAGSRVLVVA